MSYLEMSTEQIHDLIERGGLDDDMFFSLHEEAKEFEKEAIDSDICWNAVLDYVLNKGYMESPMEFLRCWNEGNFEALREEWPDAPEEIYLAEPLGSNPLYKGETK